MVGKSIPILWKFVAIAISFLIADYLGIFVHIFELDYAQHFQLPKTSGRDATEYSNTTPVTAANNYYNYTFLQKAINKCSTVTAAAPHLTVLVKSALGHAERRVVIRRTWGFEQRFSDVNYRCVFLLGASTNEATMEAIKKEGNKYRDIIQGDFEDAYFNNTIKTILGIRWAKNYCGGSHYYLFVDDDYYVSIKNVLKFIAYPELYPNDITGLWSQRQHLKAQKSNEPSGERLFAGHVMQTPPHRHKFSRWYVTLNEYPYDLWPPYVTAGAFILSNDALAELYDTGKHMRAFRFDDIYLSLLALSAKIPLTHCDMFYFKPPRYKQPENYRYVLASHGFEDTDYMEKVWSECRSAGYA